MLICPNCHAEYREGFRTCSDCDVALVQKAPQQTNALMPPADRFGGPAEEGDPNEDPFCSFWKGTDPRLHAEICSLLDEQAIPYKTVRREDHLFNLNNQPPFEIGIPFSQFQKAEAALRDAYGEDLEDPAAEASDPLLLENKFAPSKFRETTERRGVIAALLEKLGDLSTALSEAPEPRRVWDPDDWFPEDATAKVWSGDDSMYQEIFSASLMENEIHSRWDDLKGQYSLYVLSQDEARAKEIVHEIVEGTPPE